MTEFNSNLNNLFKNYQQQQQYSKKAFDVNGDGKVNSKDKTALNNEKNALMKEKNLFDVNGDGKFDQKDVDMFLKGDVNGDGKVSEDELNFISSNKSNMKSAMTKAKANFDLDGKKYAGGKPASGVIDGKYYKSGVLATGTANGKYYKDGILANGTVNGYLYKDGVKVSGIADDGKFYKNGKIFTGTNNGKYYKDGIIANGTVNGYLYKDGVKLTGTADDGKYYKNGKIYTGTVTDKETNTTTNYKSGVLQYSVTDNNNKNYPNISGSNIRFKNGSKYVNVKLEIGDKAVINADGTVSITAKDGKTVKNYDSTGKLIISETPKPTVPTEPTIPTNVPEPTIVEEPVNPVGTEYVISRNLKSIMVNGKEIKLDIGTIKTAEVGKIIVEDSGKINLYITSSDYARVDFETTEDLNIEVKQCNNKDFSLKSGKGNDNIVIAEGVVMDTVSVRDGNDTLVNNGDVKYLGGPNSLFNGNNTIINNGTVRETIYGGRGDDTITNNGVVKSHLAGGDGNDLITNTEKGEIDTMNGDDGNDTIINKGKIDTIDAGRGDDTVSNWGDVNVIWGNVGNDTITNEITGIVNKFIAGESGDDTIINKGVIDGFIDGDSGDDKIINDGVVKSSLSGGQGDDEVINNGLAVYIRGEKATNNGSTRFFNGDKISDFDITDEDIGKYKNKARNLRTEIKNNEEAYIKLKGHNILEDIWNFLFGWIRKL